MEAEEMQKAADGSRIWLPVVVDCIAHSLPANEVPCTLRLVDKSTSLLLEGFNTVRLSLPSPPESFKQRWGRPGAFRGLTRKQRLKLLCLTAASGSIANLEVALDNAGLLVTGELLEAAAEAGQLEACKFLRGRGCPWGSSLAAAARGGHRHVCEWLLTSGCPFLSDAVYEAARGGHEGLMFWLLLPREGHVADGVDLVRLLQDVAAGLHLETLQLLILAGMWTPQQQHDDYDGPQQSGFNLAEYHQRFMAEHQQQQGDDDVQPQQAPSRENQLAIMAAAAGSRTLDWQAKVQWLEGLGYPRATDSAVLVAGSSDGSTGDDDTVGRLQWLHSRGYPLDEDLVDSAAWQGNLAALRFLMEEAGVGPTVRAQWFAAMQGHLDVLQYLHTSGFPVDATQQVAYNAARGGHLLVVAWMVETLGVNPKNMSDLLEWAAWSGSIELIAWLWERGWTWSVDATVNVAESGCEEALEWLVVQGCRWQVHGDPYVVAARHLDMAMVCCLHRLGCPWGPRIPADCIYWSVPMPMLLRLVELGCPVDDWQAAEAAAEAHRPGEYQTALLEWLGEGREQRMLLLVQQVDEILMRDFIE